jgi:TP901 family phage tail tape measure protein
MAGERTFKILFVGEADKLKSAAKDTTDALDGVEKKTSGTGLATEQFAKMASVAFLGGGVAAAGFAAASVRSFADFEKGMNEVYTLLPGISGDAMGAMESDVKSFAKEFGVLPSDVIPALYNSLSAGVPPDNVFAFMETAQKAAVAGVTDLNTAVNGITSVVNAYGSDVISATQASDMMFTAVKLGKTTFGELASSLSNVTPVASAMGVSFGDVTAAIAAMTAKGTPTAVATTQLNNLFAELGKAGTKASDAFYAMSGQTFPEFIAAGGDLAGALDVINAYAGDVGVGMIDMFGSIEAGKAALSLQGNESFTNAIDAMANSAGASQTAYEQMAQGITFAIGKLKAFAAATMLDVGAKAAPVVMAALDGITAAIGFLSQNMEYVKPILIAVGSALAVVLAGALTVVIPLIWAKVAAWTAAAAAMLVANAPLLLIAAAVGLVVAAIYLLVKNWDSIVERFPILGVVVDKVKQGFQAFVGFITGTLLPIFQDVASKVGEWLGAAFGWLTGTALPAVVAGFRMVVDAVSGFVGWVTGTLIPAVMGIGSAVLGGVTGAFDAVSTWIREKVTALLNVLFNEEFRAWLNGTFLPDIQAAFAAVTEFVGKIVDWVTGTAIPKIQEAVDAVSRWIQAAFAKLQEWFGGFLGWVTGSLIPAVTAAAGAVANAIGIIVGFVADNWPRILAIMEPVFKLVSLYAQTYFGLVVTVFQTALGVLMGLWDVFAGIFTGDWGRVWDGLQKIVGSVWDGIKGIFGLGFDFLKGLIGIAAGIGSSIGNALGDALKWALKGAVNGLLGILESGINTALDGLAAMISAAKSLADAIPGANPFGDTMQRAIDNLRAGVSLPRLAAGVWEVPGPRGAGDIFPALLEPGEMVVPTRVADRFRAGRMAFESAPQVTVNLNGDVYARNKDEARAAAGDMGYALWSSLRARGIA